MASDPPTSTLSGGSYSTERRAVYPCPTPSVEDEEIAGFVNRIKSRRERLRELELRNNLDSSSSNNFQHENRQLQEQDNEPDTKHEEQRRSIRRRRTVDGIKKRTETEEQQRMKQRQRSINPNPDEIHRHVTPR